MAKGLIGKKIGMTQVFSEVGDLVPVTALELGPCSVSQVKTLENDGYAAIQLSYGEVKPTQISKPEAKHLEKNKIQAKRFSKEFKFEGENLEAGASLQIADVFAISDRVKVTGVSKGKGFQGVIKRHGHHGGPMAHGSRNHRHPGSIGACATPSRVFKGVKLPGRTGGLKTSVANLKIVKIIPESNLIYVSGSVPGPVMSLVTVEKM
ncbi:MAG: 50S ribosomal protein L3 [Leptospiraceae bacterium]|nr:50S ribosomal protein L3 [Leptospiraceae bacterium]